MNIFYVVGKPILAASTERGSAQSDVWREYRDPKTIRNNEYLSARILEGVVPVYFSREAAKKASLRKYEGDGFDEDLKCPPIFEVSIPESQLYKIEKKRKDIIQYPVAAKKLIYHSAQLIVSNDYLIKEFIYHSDAPYTTKRFEEFPKINLLNEELLLKEDLDADQWDQRKKYAKYVAAFGITAAVSAGAKYLYDHVEINYKV